MKAAVIGLGTIGGTIAKLLTEGGTDILVSERDAEKAQAFARKLGERAKPVPLEEAVGTADILILAVWFDAIKDLVQQHRSALSGKIIVDPSNPIAPDGKGGFTKTIPQSQSSGELIAAMLPNGAKLVKAFGSLSGPSLASAANRKPEKAVLFYATNDTPAGRAVAKLIEAAGFEPMSVGGIDQSIRIEVFGDLHEFGALGKVVSGRQARALLEDRESKAGAGPKSRE